MQIHQLRIKHSPAPGPIRKQFPKLWSLPEQHTILIKNQITALLWPNGTGKSTLLNWIHALWAKNLFPLLSGEKYKSTQMVDMFDEKWAKITSLKAWWNKNTQDAAYHSSLAIDEFVDALSPEENVVKQKERWFISSWQFTMLEISQAFIDAKKEEIVLLLDEPWANLDIHNKDKLLSMLEEAIQEWNQVFLATHDILLLKSLQKISDKQIWIIEFIDKNTPVKTTNLDAYLNKIKKLNSKYLRAMWI